MIGSLRKAFLVLVTLLLALPAAPHAQGTAPAAPLTMISRDGRRPVPTTMIGGQEFVALDDVAMLFQVAVREDPAGGVTVTYRGRTVVVSTDQPMASIAGRVVSLPAAAVRAGRRLLVPIDFLPRALAPIYDARIDLRRPARLLVVGDVRVPRVTARIDSAGPPTRAVIEVIPAAPVAATVEGGRVTVRIEADALDHALPLTGAGLIDSIRQGDQPGTIAVILSPRYMTARALPVTTDNVTRVTIDVIATAQGEAVPTAPAPPAALPVLPGSTPSPLTIVLDPGHGGDDAGARSPSGTLEKDVALAVARQLKGQLESRLGVRVILTREDDRGVTLDQRGAIANNAKADIFISLHLNSALAPAVSGAEVFSLKLDREAGAAGQPAGAAPAALPVLGGGTRVIDVVRWDFAQAQHAESSSVFASMLEEELRKHVPMGPRPLQQSVLRLLAALNMPAALVEIGYLSNPAQAQAAASESFQATAAQAIYDAIVRMREYVDSRRRR